MRNVVRSYLGSLVLAACVGGCFIDGYGARGEDGDPSAANADEIVGSSGSTADAMVRAVISARTNYGGLAYMDVSRANGVNSIALVRFDVPVGSAIRKATMRFYVAQGSGATASVLTVPSGTFDEQRVTYETRPAFGALVGRIPGASAGSFVEIDVSSVVTKAGSFAFAITSTSPDVLRLATREAASSAQRPRLVLDRADADAGIGVGDAGADGDGSTVGPTASSLCGTWVLEQVSGTAQLASLKAGIFAALDVPGTLGFSVRFAWNTADLDGSATTNPLLDAASALVDEYNAAHPGANKKLSIRFMAGRHTPDRVFAAGAAFYTLPSGEKVPKAWANTDTTSAFQPNSVFEDAWGAYVVKLASWSRARNVPLLHLSWYGQDWAELNHGAEVRAAAGYTYARWLTGHERLIGIAAPSSGASLAIELPVSGYGPLSGGQSAALVDEVIAKVGASSNRFFVQANGWSPTGDWGAPSDSVEVDFDAIWTKPVLRGVQMIQPNDYDWSAVFARTTTDLGSNLASHALYTEVYLPSFTGASAASLRTQIAQFSGRCPR